MPETVQECQQKLRECRIELARAYRQKEELLAALKRLAATFYADAPCVTVESAVGPVHKLSSGHLVNPETCAACAARTVIARAESAP